MQNRMASVRWQWTARTLAGLASLGAACLLVACGGDDQEPASAPAADVKAAASDPASGKTDPVATQVKPVDAESRLATAVPESKTTAPIDLQYDIPVKPEAGQLFFIELAVQPRLPGDKLDVEVTDSPGIAVEGERTARFLAVEAGKPYAFKVQARANRDGLYYVSVITKLSSKVQSEGRAFAVPVVIGTPNAAQKAAPPKDATGQAIESMPAKEQ